MEAMNEIHSELTKINGVYHVVPSKRVNTIGEWKILVDQTKSSYIHRTMTKEWSKIVATIPEEILKNSPIQFPAPSISSKKIREYQESESDEDSYGSLLSAGTETSQMTSDETTLNELPEEYQFPSYAAAAMASNTSTDSTYLSSPTVSINHEWQKEKQDLEAQIQYQALQIEKIQADLQSRMIRSHELEEKLAQALDLAHSRDARHEEMMAKFEELMQRETQRPYDQVEALPSTPERLAHGYNQPPTKKANTNTSPHRNIYSLFRQSQGKAQAGRVSYPNRPGTDKRIEADIRPTHSSKHQMMEIDEDYPKPAPGGKSGKKLE